MVSRDFDITTINTFPKLLGYLLEELDWPIDEDSFDDATYDYTPEELDEIFNKATLAHQDE